MSTTARAGSDQMAVRSTVPAPSDPPPTAAIRAFLAEVDHPYHRPPPGFQPTMSVNSVVDAAETRARNMIAALELSPFPQKVSGLT
ncbi:hypothetical protein BGZ61DRAFT_449523 [Ilyonectria robusta]|uniref:uncharacterized protein n=1 Tax=Ilyonectria robusta TaxID=1079257 RepID=UPI001E8D7DD0|nr:uncharacterized protein BGZ61DRAFT_449523 [Ilyonectria robusta]KAH8706189.1 hypothetical protein BGZ61DRAFT_449523 [Ilyonectria robusta]